MADTPANPPRQRDIMFCHSCENEWYRDEHGLTCPECQSDFTEIVEADHDPREDNSPAPVNLPQQGENYAPDPDEDDIDNLRWEETGPGRYRVRGRYTTDIPLGPGQQVPQGQGGLMGMVGSVLQNMLGGQAQQIAQQQQAQQQQVQQQQQPPNTPGRPASAPGSPPPNDPQQPRGTFVRHGHGPGFSYTIASSSNTTFNGNNLFPRNANAPQPFQPQPDHIEHMINQMMMNLGAAPGGMRGPPFHDHGMHPGFGPAGGVGGGPFIIGGGGAGGMGGMGPFGNLFQLFGPPGGVAGDAVYTQEALDRIMTQLMEQHQAGNAPGPASSDAIAALPKRAITKEDQDDAGKADCSICMDEIPLGDTVTFLPCSHWFHHECIKAWLSEHDTCPHCRQGIMPKDGDASRSSVPRSPSQAPLHDMHSPQSTRPAGMPGAFPFPSTNSGGGQGSGTAHSPFVVPDSPEMPRRPSSTGDGRASSSGGLFSRMRDTFGRGSSSGPGGAGSGEGGSGRG